MKDVLDISLDIHEDDTSEMKLTKDNINAFVLVSVHVEMIKNLSALCSLSIIAPQIK